MEWKSQEGTRIDNTKPIKDLGTGKYQPEIKYLGRVGIQQLQLARALQNQGVLVPK